jgi:hypothetical protein
MSESKLIDRLNQLPPCETPHYAIALNPMLKRPELLAAIARACGGAAANLRSSRAREVAQAAGVPRGLHVRLGERCFDSVMATFLLWNDCNAARGYEPDHVCLSYEGDKRSLCSVALPRDLRDPARGVAQSSHHLVRTRVASQLSRPRSQGGLPRRHTLRRSTRWTCTVRTCTQTGWLLTVNRRSGQAGSVDARPRHYHRQGRSGRTCRAAVGSRGWRCCGMDWHRDGPSRARTSHSDHNVHIRDRHLYHRAQLVKRMNPSAVWLYYHDDHDLESWVDGLIRYLCGWHGLGKLI